jgi:hypothetical protein
MSIGRIIESANREGVLEIFFDGLFQDAETGAWIPYGKWLTPEEYAQAKAEPDWITDILFPAQEETARTQYFTQFGATLGDELVLTHQAFGAQWGWRAEFSVQSDAFTPGVRAIAIYADAACTQYLYTTGAFQFDDGTWFTQWNPGNSSKGTYYVALLFGGNQESIGALTPGDIEVRIPLRHGLVQEGDLLTEWTAGRQYLVGQGCTYLGSVYTCLQQHTAQVGWEPPIVPALWQVTAEKPEPEPGETWVDTGATVTGQAGTLYYVSQPIVNLGLTIGQAIKLGNAETTYAGTWTGTNNLMQISPYVAASIGAKVWKWA